MEKQDKVFIVGVQLGRVYTLHLLSDLRSGKEREEEERKYSVCVSVSLSVWCT